MLGDKSDNGLIAIPYRPPEEYDYRVEFTTLDNKTSGGCQHLAKGMREFTWNFYSTRDHGIVGFEEVRGKTIWNNRTETKLAPNGSVGFGC